MRRKVVAEEDRSGSRWPHSASKDGYGTGAATESSAAPTARPKTQQRIRIVASRAMPTLHTTDYTTR
jgi:hypothetical protein